MMYGSDERNGCEAMRGGVERARGASFPRQDSQTAAAELTIEELTDAAELEPLRTEWSGLFDASKEATPFQSPEWLLPWWRCFAGRSLWVLAARLRGRLVGLAPLFIYTDPASKERRVCFIGNGISDSLDILVAGEEGGPVAQAVFDHIARRARLWDTCDFRDLPPGSAVLRARVALELSEQVKPEEPCPVLQLPRTPDRIVPALARRLRDNLRRSERRAWEQGEVLHEIATPATRAELLGAVFQLHAARWSARGETGVLDTRAHLQFHEEATAGLQARGLLRLHVLRIGSHVVAAQYILRHQQRAYLYITGFDPSFAALSPGALLTRRVLEQAVRDGDREFDFLRGRERYKYLWGAVDRPQYRRRVWK
ncbi:MAG: glycosyl transferase group 1 [Gammaproteobacteria bacterium]|nr:glycosyl transferase group 1 [Gammaproteobacteria bacterium]